MDEQKQNTAAENINNGIQPQSLDKVERAEQAVKRMEEYEKRIDEKIAKLQELQADRLLSGTAGGRIESPTQKTPKQYADEVMSGRFGNDRK
jgi:hypothetical protein